MARLINEIQYWTTRHGATANCTDRKIARDAKAFSRFCIHFVKHINVHCTKQSLKSTYKYIGILNPSHRLL